MKMECLIIGLGVFGQALAKNLAEQNAVVVGIDLNDKLLRESEKFVDQTIKTDSTVEDNLRVIGIDNFDYVFVCIGVNLQASIITTLHLNNLGAKKIIARSNSLEHTLILQKLGAHKVITPELESGERLAQEVTSNFENFIKFSDNFAVVQMEVPDEMISKSLSEMNLRKKYKVNVLSVRKNEVYVDSQGEDTVIKDIEVIPDPAYRFKKFDRIYVVGDIKNIRKFVDIFSGEKINAS
jgi:trk system potassium uptake protein TrkA